MRLIIDDKCDPYLNMARDEAILNARIEGLVDNTIRFYGWEKPSISLGYFQKAEKDLNIMACNETGIGIVRRITGGRAVFHEKELTYSISVSCDNPLFSGNIKNSFLSVSRCLLHGFKLLGIECEIITRRENSKKESTPVCFDSISWYEIAVNGKKIAGIAQTKKKGFILQQGSILINFDPIKMIKYFNFNNKDKVDHVEILESRITGIERLLNRIVSPAEIRKCLIEGFRKNWSLDFYEDILLEQEKISEEYLLKNKYSKDLWNIQRQSNRLTLK